MPNWCGSAYAICGPNKEDLETISNFLRVSINTPSSEFKGHETASEGWFGKALLKAGLDPSKDELYCRGFVQNISPVEQSIDEDYYYVIVESEDAWGPIYSAYMVLLDSDLFKRQFGELTMYCQAEEPGCELYLNTDTSGKVFSDRYYVEFIRDVDTGDYDCEYYASDEVSLMLTHINEHLGKKLQSIEDVKKYVRSDESDEKSIRFIEFDTDYY